MNQSNFSEIVLNTKRLALRKYKLEDLDSVHSYGKDPDFSKYEPWGPNNLEQTKDFILQSARNLESNQRYKYELAIELKKEKRQIGGCGLRLESEQSSVASIVWAVAPSFQNNGYATEAAQRMFAFGFQNLGLLLIYATCDLRNTTSARVMEKLGMNKVGLLKDHIMQKGQMRSTLRYEIINPNWDSISLE